MRNDFKAKVFDTQEELNEFFLKNDKIKIIKVEKNGDRRALFYEEEFHYPVVTPYNEYNDGWEGMTADDYDKWNARMWAGGKFPPINQLGYGDW